MSVADASAPLLDVRDLNVHIDTSEGVLHAVRDVSFSVHAGSAVAIVGESGSGKTLTARALIGLAGPSNVRASGSVRYGGRDLIGLSDAELCAVRGRSIGMIAQDAMTALNPVLRVGDQIAEAVRAHERVSRREARERAVALLREVGISEPARRADAYPHELSGGMRQRALIAMALACGPEVLIADEPTTALDVTVQAQVLELLKRTSTARETALVFITHDLGIVAEIADEIVVMYGGEVVERGPTAAVFRDPRHPYTRGLLGSSPRADRPPLPRMPAIPGGPPSLRERVAGCRFRPRCEEAFERCLEHPALEARGDDAERCDRCWLNAPAEGSRQHVETVERGGA